MPYPLSNVKVITGHTLTEDDFLCCERCAAGEHAGWEAACDCCGLPITSKIGDFIPFTRTEAS
jgi:hypothetical protein